MIPDGWIFPLETPAPSQAITCTSQSTLATRSLLRVIWCSLAVLCSVKVHWISLIQTCKQINTWPYQYQYTKKHMKNPWRWLPHTLLHFHCHSRSREVLCAETTELLLASGAIELWQHPGAVGPGESQSLLTINSIATPARQEHKGGELLLTCGFWVRQISTSLVGCTELGCTHKAV